MEFQSCVKIINEWDIVAARQLGRNVAKELGFGTVDQARITTAISELARNIYLYAGQGSVSIEKLNINGKSGLKIIAEDQGPGIEDIRRVMEDGYTTSGGLGAGLPGAKRLMDDFDIESIPGEGTKIIATKWLR
ncbi:MULTISPECIES: anti-sigma regulatory factor [Bacillales]|jgi:serine/threonine-protein kinase RsbT|uniref:Anti-sigma regulatory factor n=4 Tax=Peribacillus TaxID=2675229 RepID=A0A098ER03_9BACI|nr:MULTISPECIES: anti-sigma regulatory factor [Bacillales]KRF54075.1 serine/threonine protein kinase [Bacillus sp. Soil745]MBD8138716.1 anti-sigma regulatory factor [Bacillus sp. CFBP 13597]MBL3645600.1 anti-sigma regulatory factor [Bacillus sp. RHFB]MBT2603102.1 anti-sigma regulatory factor [Bacillus sp. ISL-53]MBT2673907.1 anti-sigma regulatory factor [Streptomyces sp. ISL-14]MCD1163739.1 anti-sigma regulatory factor [Peribacillus castrilensis]MCP1097116.1 anti-sigma regulatory factor [Bac